MPTARELLEQADALMRRNRARVVDTEIPELTDVVPDAILLPPAPAALDEVPELSDAVEEIEIASIAELPEDRGRSSEWLRLDREVVTTGSSAAQYAEAIPPVPESALVDAQPPTATAGEEVPPEPAASPASAEAVEPAALSESADTSSLPESPPAVRAAEASGPAAGDDWARWQAIAEEIRMQVLQRIDIFTDTGLREQLAVQLQPIVDRASGEMVAKVNEQVGTLLRAYIAEAIEREIEKWRKGNT